VKAKAKAGAGAGAGAGKGRAHVQVIVQKNGRLLSKVVSAFQHVFFSTRRHSISHYCYPRRN
jgi:hypothetical protein